MKKTERYDVWAVVSAAISFGSLLFVTYAPPIIGPSLSPWAMSLSMVFLACAIGTVVCLVLAAKQRQHAILALVAIVAMFFITRYVSPDSEELWRENFRRTKAERVRLTNYLREHEPNKNGMYEIPAAFESIAAHFAVRAVDDQGRRFFTHAAFLSGIDNAVAFCWSESGAPPPENALFEVVTTVPLGDHWFLLYTT